MPAHRSRCFRIDFRSLASAPPIIIERFQGTGSSSFHRKLDLPHTPGRSPAWPSSATTLCQRYLSLSPPRTAIGCFVVRTADQARSRVHFHAHTPLCLPPPLSHLLCFPLLDHCMYQRRRGSDRATLDELDTQPSSSPELSFARVCNWNVSVRVNGLDVVEIVLGWSRGL